MPTTSAAPDAGRAAVPAWPAPPWLPRWCRIAVLLVIEDQAGRHATGRSAAMFFEGYGNQTVRALTRASRAFLERPPEGFSEVPLMTPRAAMMVADAEGAPRLDARLGGSVKKAPLAWVSRRTGRLPMPKW